MGATQMISDLKSSDMKLFMLIINRYKPCEGAFVDDLFGPVLFFDRQCSGDIARLHMRIDGY